MVEQMMEFRLSDGTIGYGMGEGGFRFPGKAMVTDMIVRTPPPADQIDIWNRDEIEPRIKELLDRTLRDRAKGPLRREPMPR
jgi:hypothetical protein